MTPPPKGGERDSRSWKERAIAAEAGCVELRKMLGAEKVAGIAVTIEATKRGWTVRVHSSKGDGTFDLEEEKAMSIAMMHLLLESANSITHATLMLQLAERFTKATAETGLAIYQRHSEASGKDNHP